MADSITYSGGTISPQLVLGYDMSRAARNVVHEIIDRAEPDVSLRPGSLRAGELRLLFTDEDAAHTAAVALSGAEAFTFTSTTRPTLTMRFVVDGAGVALALDDGTRELWTVTVTYREVAGP